MSTERRLSAIETQLADQHRHLTQILLPVTQRKFRKLSTRSTPILPRMPLRWLPILRRLNPAY